MAFIGKTFVMLFTMASITLLLWATMLYTQRVHWTSTTPETKGIIQKSETEIKNYQMAAHLAQYRWSRNYSTIVNLEGNEKYPRRDFYVEMISTIRTGRNTAGMVSATPAAQMVFDNATGYLDIRPTTQRPAYQFRAGVDGQSIAQYTQALATTFEAIEMEQVQNQKYLMERKIVNDEIVGTVDPFVKGLRLQINEQNDIAKSAVAEADYIASFVTNRSAESVLLIKRFNSMSNRKSELEQLKTSSNNGSR